MVCAGFEGLEGEMCRAVEEFSAGESKAVRRTVAAGGTFAGTLRT